jgi:membrane protein
MQGVEGHPVAGSQWHAYCTADVIAAARISEVPGVREIRRDPVGIGKETFAGFQESDGTGMAAEAAYRIVFALPASLIFFVSLSSLVARYTGVDVFGMLLDWGDDTLPQELFETFEIILENAEEQAGFGVLSIGFLIALWSASNAMSVLVKAINRAHAFDDTRGMVKQRALSVGLTIGLSVLVLASFVLFVFGQQIGEILANAFGLGDLFTIGWNILRWPALILLFVAALSILYWLAPVEHVRPRTQLTGALLATLLWLIATAGFSVYLNFSDPGNAYGVIGGLIVLLLFLYISSIVIIIGVELNAAIRRRRFGHVLRIQAEEHPLAAIDGTVYEIPDRNYPRLVAWAVIAALFILGLVGGRRGKRDDESSGGLASGSPD